jgi:long-chain acyl-CoA synthetase
MYRALTAVDRDSVAAAFGTVRLAMSGAAPLPATVAERLRAITTVDIEQGYGLTETGPVLTCTVGAEAKPGSIGRPIPGVELWLRDQDGDPVEDGDPGEVVVRGRNLFSGYWPDGADGPDDAGWFDVAYLDVDGDLHLVDRRKELIIVSGFNVYPAEVEAVLLAHPAVAEAAVVGLPDEHRGERIKAFVVVRSAGTGTAELASWCARSLARFKCPTEFELVPELPHSATGKVRKARLRSQP